MNQMETLEGPEIVSSDESRQVTKLVQKHTVLEVNKTDWERIKKNLGKIRTDRWNWNKDFCLISLGTLITSVISFFAIPEVFKAISGDIKKPDTFWLYVWLSVASAVIALIFYSNHRRECSDHKEKISDIIDDMDCVIPPKN